MGEGVEVGAVMVGAGERVVKAREGAGRVMVEAGDCM
jgi:hypothetical protein